MISKPDATAREMWNILRSEVLAGGEWIAPRGRKTCELNDVTYSMMPHQHLDPNPARNIKLDYVRREFAWFLFGDKFDTRIAKYAAIWKSCIGSDGSINSNYGQYMFNKTLNSPFFNALDKLHEDPASRRAWISIFQSHHQNIEIHNDYPCTTGWGFRIENNQLVMRVHMRSQDMWWGAPNDAGCCFFAQLLAQAYMRYMWNSAVTLGPIIHKIDSLHFYERHVIAASNCIVDERPDLVDISNFTNMILTIPITNNDLRRLVYGGSASSWNSNTAFTDLLLNFEGDYGKDDPHWNGYALNR